MRGKVVYAFILLRQAHGVHQLALRTWEPNKHSVIFIRTEYDLASSANTCSTDRIGFFERGRMYLAVFWSVKTSPILVVINVMLHDSEQAKS